MGAPLAELVLAVFPIAPDPFVPEVSLPAKVIIVIAAAGEDCEKLAVTETFDRIDGAKALQISAVPPCTSVRTTGFQFKPAPVTPLTVILDWTASLEISARISSLLVTVEKTPLLIVMDDDA